MCNSNDRDGRETADTIQANKERMMKIRNMEDLSLGFGIGLGA